MNYPYLRAWLKLMQAHPQRVEKMVKQAEDDKAPQDAVYIGNQGWVSIDEASALVRNMVKATMELPNAD